MLSISTDSIITRAAEADGWDVAFWYGVMSAPAMAFYLTVAERGRPIAAWHRSGSLVLVSGLLQMASTTAFILAIKNTSVANVVVIIAAAPMITAILALALWGERLDTRLVLAIALAFVGILIVVSGSLGSGGLAGDLLAIGAVVSFGLNLVIWRRHPEMSRILVVALSGVGAALIAAGPAQITGHPSSTYLLIALMAVVFGPVGRVALASATRHLPAAQVSLFAPIETVAATSLAWVFFSEKPGLRSVVGGVIIVTAVLLGTIRATTSRPPPTVPSPS